jgi:hypothetical protein
MRARVMLGVDIPPSAKRPQKCDTPNAIYADILSAHADAL